MGDAMAKRIYEQDNAEGKLTIDLGVNESGGVEIFFHDIGAAAKRLTGDSDYERAVTIPADQIAQLALNLLADRFADDIQAQSKIETYCEERQIETKVWSF